MPAIRSEPAGVPLFDPYRQYAVPERSQIPDVRVPESYVRTRIEPNHGSQAVASRNAPEIDELVAADLARKTKTDMLYQRSLIEQNVQIPTKEFWEEYQRTAALERALLHRERELRNPLATGSKEMEDFLRSVDTDAALSRLRGSHAGFPHAKGTNATIHNTTDYHVETATRDVHGNRDSIIFDERGEAQNSLPHGDNKKTPRQCAAAVKKRRVQTKKLAEQLRATLKDLDFSDFEMEVLSEFATKVRGAATAKARDAPFPVAASELGSLALEKPDAVIPAAIISLSRRALALKATEQHLITSEEHVEQSIKDLFRMTEKTLARIEANNRERKARALPVSVPAVPPEVVPEVPQIPEEES